MDEQYRRQVTLLVRILPFVAEEKCFALKGGTAINLFIRDLPRLSVDIDLTYLPVEHRSQSLRSIDAALSRIENRLLESVPAIRVYQGRLPQENVINKLYVRERNVQIKIEVTPVLRGCVYESSDRSVTKTVEENFGFSINQVLSIADLYAGKLIAALHRQHPRDLFDIRDMLLTEGVDDKMRIAFVVYLISHHRPIATLLSPVRRDISREFTRGLVGLVKNPIALDELVQVREALIAELVGQMPVAHRQFLLSFQKCIPDWSLLGVKHVRTLPAIRWRMKKLSLMDEIERADHIAQLESII